MPDGAVDALADTGRALLSRLRRSRRARRAGEIDAAGAVRERVALLAGMTEERVEQVRNSQDVTPDARTFVRTLRRLGFYVGVVSGGFTVFTDRLVDELGLDFAAANELEIVDGVVTGGVIEPIMDRAGRADALRRFADKFGVPLSQTVAVGEGAGDIDMLETAGLGIAFNAKSASRAATDESATVAAPGHRAVRARDEPRRDRRRCRRSAALAVARPAQGADAGEQETAQREVEPDRRVLEEGRVRRAVGELDGEERHRDRGRGQYGAQGPQRP